MKLYKRNKKYQFDYPEDMKKILDYLKKRGEILVEEQYIERAYRQFCDETRCAGWCRPGKGLLIEFEAWLVKYDD